MISCAIAKVRLRYALKDTMIMLAPMLVIVRWAESRAADDSLSVAWRMPSFFAMPSVSACRSMAAASSA